MESATTSPATRRALLVLVIVAGALTAAAILQRDRALEQAYEDAESRAELYTATVLRSALSPADLSGIEESRERVILGEVQPLVLTDPAVARVRLWRPDGTLLFSSDPADDPGVVSSDPIIAGASSGLPRSRLGVEPVSVSEAQPVPTPLFESFVPLQLRGAEDVGAVAEIEQFAAVLESTADDPWWLVRIGASAATVLLALLALVSVARGARRPAASSDARSRRGRRAWSGDAEDLQRRLEAATARAKDAEGTAAAYAAQLQQATERVQELERRTPDERVAELGEALKRSEAERALLRAGRPETTVEVELRQLRAALQDARSRAKAAEALAAGKGDMTAVQEQLSAAEREMERAVERAKLAEARAAAAEDRSTTAGELASAAEQRIDLLETKLQEVAASAMSSGDDAESGTLRQELAAATARADELERRLAEANGRVTGTVPDDVLASLEERIAAAEARAAEAEQRLRAFEEDSVEHGSAFRHTLGVRAAGRKLSAPPPSERTPPAVEPEAELRQSISRGLRGPLTRAAGLTLSLQGAVGSNEGKNVVRQLSSSLRRLDQLTADLHDVRRIAEGTLPLSRRRTDVTALLTTTLEEADHLHEDRLVRLDAERLHANVDPARLRQIVEGMLDASRERTRAGAAIVVRARSIEGGILISVEDDNKTPAVVGPEMSLAARLADLHGTELVAEGSSYRLVLPAEEG